MKTRLFISYSTKDKQIADALVRAIEKDTEFECFIAPRDIHDGEYAQQIVEAIENANSVVLIFSESSNVSAYVLREMNSAVLRSVPIIPYRIDNAQLSKSMEFYLGVVQWLDAYKMSEKESLESLKKWLAGTAANKAKSDNDQVNILYPDYTVLREKELKKIGYDVSRTVMETIEIDYITLNENDGDYVLNEEIEGSYVDWAKHVKTYPDIYALLVKGDKAVGYYQYELLSESNYKNVISGTVMVHPQLMEFYAFGGEFYLYIVMLSVLKEHENTRTVMMLWDRLFQDIEELISGGVAIKKIAISIYSYFIKKVAKSMGFELINSNLALGEIYELDMSSASGNKAIKNRYPKLYTLLKERT